MSSPAFDVHKAIVAAAEADVELTAYAGRSAFLHSFVAPQGTDAPYGVLGSTSEDSFSTFARVGAQGEITINLYASINLGARGTLQFYSLLHSLLHNTILPLDAGEHLSGTLEMVISYPDPDNSELAVTVARYTYVARGGV